MKEGATSVRVVGDKPAECRELPTMDCRDFNDVGGRKLSTAEIWSGLTLTPLSVSMYPKKHLEVHPKVHFPGSSLRWNVRSWANTCSRCVIWLVKSRPLTGMSLM